jgi:hypothetical protein
MAIALTRPYSFPEEARELTCDRLCFVSIAGLRTQAHLYALCAAAAVPGPTEERHASIAVEPGQRVQPPAMKGRRHWARIKRQGE